MIITEIPDPVLRQPSLLIQFGKSPDPLFAHSLQQLIIDTGKRFCPWHCTQIFRNREPEMAKETFKLNLSHLRFQGSYYSLYIHR